MTPEETLDWLAQQHFDQCREERPIQDWIRKMKSQLPAQPEQEPVAWIWKDMRGQKVVSLFETRFDSVPLYTTPPQRKLLTDEKISLIAHNIDSGDWNDLNFKECWHEGFKAGFREAEIEHNIKGTT